MTSLKGYSHLLKIRQGWGRWRWLHIRVCKKCGTEHRILGNDTRLRPTLGVGAIRCVKCDENVLL